MKVEFTIHGPPVGKGRPQFSTYGGHVTARTPQKTVIYENLVKMEYQQQSDGQKFDNDSMLEVEIDAYYPIPKSVSKKKQSAMMAGEIRPVKKPDCDNVVKVILDSLNHIAYHDDVQVVDVSLHKWYSDEPRVVVVMQEARHPQESEQGLI
jgi:Holliday junction resolvase RusA-like endonuclease